MEIPDIGAAIVTASQDVLGNNSHRSTTDMKMC